MQKKMKKLPSKFNIKEEKRKRDITYSDKF